MTKYETKPNTGSMFPNGDKKEALAQGDGNAENWADFNGSVNVGGRDYWINGWRKTSKDGTKKFLSLSFKPKDGGPQRKPTYSKDDTVARQTAAQEMDDEILF